jgi:Flp pilus assembly protein TadB
MSEGGDRDPDDADDGAAANTGGEPEPDSTPAAGDDAGADASVANLREELEAFREEVESRTLHRDDIEADLRRYIRWRVRRGHAREWGPYLVLLYGTVMTVGAFFYLSGGWAIAAMVVVWLSTLGLYVFMIVVGWLLSLAGVPGRLRNRIGR